MSKKNKHILILLAFLMLQIRSAAQYLNILDTTNEWKIIQTTNINNSTTHNYIHYRCEKKTYHKNNHQYTSIYGTNNDSAWVRGDGYKIYGIVKKTSYTMYDPNEYLLYDFSANIGDTVFSKPPNYYVIKAIDNALIANLYYKVFDVENNLGSQYCIIEGIGCIKDPLLPYYNTLINEDRTLKCFSIRYQNPPVVYQNHILSFDNVTSCSDTALHIKSTEVSPSVNIYPQPAHDIVTLKFNYNVTSGYFYLYDALGRILAKEKLENRTEINVSKPLNNCGLYYYIIINETDNLSYPGKLLFE